MQAAAGTRGARRYSADDLDLDFEWIGKYNETAKAQFPANRQDQGIFIKYASFNLRDLLRADDTSTPLQFRYAAADCRLYYTINNVYNMTALWHDVARAAFQDPSLCVEGSTGYTSTSGTASPKAPPKPSAVSAPAPGIAVTFSDDYDPLSRNGLPDDFEPRPPCVETRACEPDGKSYTCRRKGGVCRVVDYTCDGIKAPEYVCVPFCNAKNKCNGSKCTRSHKIFIEQEQEFDRHQGLVIKGQDRQGLGFCKPENEVSAVCNVPGRPRPQIQPPQPYPTADQTAASEAGFSPFLAGLGKRSSRCTHQA